MRSSLAAHVRRNPLEAFFALVLALSLGAWLHLGPGAALGFLQALVGSFSRRSRPSRRSLNLDRLVGPISPSSPSSSTGALSSIVMMAGRNSGERNATWRGPPAAGNGPSSSRRARPLMPGSGRRRTSRLGRRARPPAGTCRTHGRSEGTPHTRRGRQPPEACGAAPILSRFSRRRRRARPRTAA
jgi:hypothetical protein